MSALAFLSKKSWHTGLQQNQEAVWKAEKSALEERRKVDELRKERDREREIQELERLQEEAGGGKKRVEKVDWMYNAPASGSNIDKNELEDYLLGKKRVDKLLQADEGLKHSRGTQQGPIEEQKALGSDRDVAAKIREDPMFAIKQQEQAAYQALLKDPARLRAMKKAAGMSENESKEDRKKRRKEEKRRRREENEEGERGKRRSSRDGLGEEGSSRRRREGGGRGGSDGREEEYRYRDGHSSTRYDHDDYYRRESHRRDAQDRYSPHRRDQYDRYAREDDTRERRRRYDNDERDSREDYWRRDRYEPHYPSRQQQQRSPPPPPAAAAVSRRRSRSPPPVSSSSSISRQAGPSGVDVEAERAAKLAAMQQNATELTTSRSSYLERVKQEEDENARREQDLRAKLQKSKEKGYGEGKGSFLVQQQRDLYGSGMDLNERLKRSREGLQRFDGD